MYMRVDLKVLERNFIQNSLLRVLASIFRKLPQVFRKIYFFLSQVFGVIV